MKLNCFRTACASITLALLATHSYAGENFQHFEYAKVVNSSPIYQTIERRVPHQECWNETVRVERPQRSSSTPTLVGGLIGGALGHAVGNGKKNKKIGTVVGTLIGMSVGADQGRARADQHSRHSTQYRDEQRCETVYRVQTEQQLQGYDVTYRYNGENRTTFMTQAPGKRVKLAVSVSPVSHY